MQLPPRQYADQLVVKTLYEIWATDGHGIRVAVALPFQGREDGWLLFGDGPNGIWLKEDEEILSHVSFYRFDDTL